MIPQLILSTGLKSKENLICVNPTTSQWQSIFPEKRQAEYYQKKIKSSAVIRHSSGEALYLLIKTDEGKNEYRKQENLRRIGNEIAAVIASEKIKSFQLAASSEEVIPFLEGLLLSLYHFQKYKSKKTDKILQKIEVVSDLKKSELEELKNLVHAVYCTRDLVNEPASHLTVVEFGGEIKRLGKDAGFKVEILNKKKIESLRMGGLLGVNQGSTEPPVFIILEYKSSSVRNKKPIVLVGKGVVYDTGGLSLKPSESMELMKCDMAGGAAVAGTLYAAAKNKLPVHLIGLIPATDNRPWENAISPGDVISISDGTTVEVINTDAEGRLILADALVYAKRFKPELVIDLATLTGAAIRAIGKEGIALMGNAPDKVKKEFMLCGDQVHERMVEFPLWEEYGKQLESDIADIKNLGGPEAGAITAAKFLEHFVDYNWLHLDIAGPAYLTSADSYRGKNGTGVGVRLLYRFLKTI